MRSTVPIYKDVVLVGGGHAHVEVLRRFAMRRPPGVRVTLVTPDVLTPYSGMLPGFVSGFYTHEDCHIDLEKLTHYADARLVLAAASGVDALAREVIFEGRPPLSYDVLSLNVGITPAIHEVPGAAQHAVPVKPISTFAAKFESLLQLALSSDIPLRLIIVGGGPGGVELACALRYRLKEERRKANFAAPVSLSLVSKGPILSGLSPYARRAFLPLLEQRGIEVYETQNGVHRVDPNALVLASDDDDSNLGTKLSLPFDACLWCTQASAPSWIAKNTDLPTNERGFLLVNDFLQLHNGPPEVFAVGDAATSVNHPRPKAGVYAVRAGPPLFDNVVRFLEGRPLQAWVPQATHLNVISAGDRYAVAVKGWFGAQGAFLWTLKDYIDRKFMAKYGNDLNFESKMAAPGQQHDAVFSTKVPFVPASSGDSAARLLAAAAEMRCGGCGAKVGAGSLSLVLERLQAMDRTRHGTAIDERAEQGELPSLESEMYRIRVLESANGQLFEDDAAVLPPPPPDHVTIHTVDFFRAMIDDPYTLGAIAATHALSDCYAMGAHPTAALALAMVPFAAPRILEGDLFQLMAGAKRVLDAAECRLVGGHSSESSELGVGFSIYGHAKPQELLKKGGLLPGQALVLSKPLGTGVLLAAAMRGLAKGRWMTNAFQSMLVSNKGAMEVLKHVGATGCTDVTGFGLLGHAVEMVRAAARSGRRLGIEIDLDAVETLSGALECAAFGVRSSLHGENERVFGVIGNAEASLGREHGVWPLLVDPQTSGGLLAAVPAEMAEECVALLKAQGLAGACIVGKVMDGAGMENGACIQVKT